MRGKGLIGEKMKKRELLAPAGSYDALVAAVQGGADAVYLSGKSFGARKFASNFDLEEMEVAVRYCHIRNVKVYVTVNILVKDAEIEALINYIGKLYTIDVDAVIVQDIGVLKLIKSHYPDFECHGSTQMTLHNIDDVRVAQSLGLKRVVLARELSVGEIQHIIDQTGVEVEAFVHGALCISYSGQCLMSSMIGGRSGNRGRCAQACRKQYDLVTYDEKDGIQETLKKGYLLSPKDLSAASEIDKILESGIYSYKIEGRMKGPEYTYQVVSTYRKMIDAFNDDHMSQEILSESMEALSKVFNREFTKGLLLGDQQKNRMSTDTPSNKGYYVGEVVTYNEKRQQLSLRLAEELSVGDDVQIRREGKSVGARVEHVFIGDDKEKIGFQGQLIRIPFKHKAFSGEKIYKTYDKVLASEIHQWLDKERLKFGVDVKVTLIEGKPLELTVEDERGNSVCVTGERLVEKAMKVALSEDRIKEQINKIGDTPFYVKTCVITSDEGVTLPIKEINRVRREALEVLQTKRSLVYPDRKMVTIKPFDDEKIINSEDLTSEVELTCSVSNLEQLSAVIASDVKIIYYKDIKTATEAYELCKESDCTFYLHENRIMHDRDIEKQMEWLKNHSQAGLLTGHIGGILQTEHRSVMGDFSLNIMNSQSLEWYDNNGLESLMPSAELTAEEVKKLTGTSGKKEWMIFGRQALMMMKYCPVKECNLCKDTKQCVLDQHGLIDEKGMMFPLYGTDCQHVQVLNGPYVNLVEHVETLKKMDITRLRLEFFNEGRSFVNGALSMVKKALTMDSSYKDDEEWLKTTYDISYTNGHFKRGVE